MRVRMFPTTPSTPHTKSTTPLTQNSQLKRICTGFLKSLLWSEEPIRVKQTVTRYPVNKSEVMKSVLHIICRLLWLTHDLSIAVNSSASTEIPMLHCMTVTSCSDAFVESLHPIQFIRNTVTFGNSPVSKFFQKYH